MLSTIPNLPTDNLYKFISLSGVLLVLVSVLFMEINYSKFDAIKYKAEAQISQIEKLHELARINKGENGDQFIEEARKKIQSNQILIAEMQTLNDVTGKRINLMTFTFTLGMILSFAGFSLWYFRVQKPLDELLQANLKNSKNTLKRRVPFRDKIGR